MMKRRLVAVTVLGIGGFAAVAGCNTILGLERATLIEPDGGGGSGATTASSSTGGPTCTDGMKNGVETDKDCGGGTCNPCPNGEGCIVGPDCLSKQCQGGTCVAFSCTDKVKNGSETDVDCGGGTCNRCDIGKNCLVSSDCLSDICKSNICRDPHVWSEAFEPMGPAVVTDVAVDGSGNIGLAIDLSGVVDFGKGQLTCPDGTGDIAVAKFDSFGKPVWSASFGDISAQSISGIAFDAAGQMVLAGVLSGTIDFGNGAITSAGGCCPSSPDILVAKLDADGLPVWSRKFGDSSPQRALGVALDSQGNVFLTGSLQSSADFGPGGKVTSTGSSDVFVVKLDAAGVGVWSKNYGDAGMQYGQRIAADSSGNVIVAGAFQGTLDFGPGGMVTSNGGFNIFVAKLGPNGTPLWSIGYGNNGDETSPDVAVDSAGNVFIASDFGGTIGLGGKPLKSAGGNDFLLAKLDANGKHLWSKQFGDAKDQVVHTGPRVSVDAAGNVVLSGGFAGTMDLGGGPLVSVGEDDVFVAKFDPAGTHMWSRRFGDAKNQGSHGIAVSGPENVVVAGNFAGTLDFGGTPLVSASGDGVFVTKLLLP
jgi:hypothetical protein